MLGIPGIPFGITWDPWGCVGGVAVLLKAQLIQVRADQRHVNENCYELNAEKGCQRGLEQQCAAMGNVVMWRGHETINQINSLVRILARIWPE